MATAMRTAVGRAVGRAAVVRVSPRRALATAPTTEDADGDAEAKAAASTATPATPVSFIEAVKVKGANALLGAFVHRDGFDRCLAGLRVERIGAGTVECVVPVTSALANSYGTLHGGATSTLVDVVGTMALLTQDPLRAGVSVELNVSFLAAAKLGEEVVIEGRVLRSGKKLGFTQVDLRRKSDRTLLATGRHTKAL